jgi:undecaprenyl phosphate N,N'-diacetylbacillosamine 1-phosphate transferase
VYKKWIKRLIDIIISLIGIILFSPVFTIILMILMIANKGKPFFFQSRPGKDEKLFSLIKFKTMTDEQDKDGNMLSDEFRMTKIGSFVRRTSLDEIPQLVNVLLGSMSLVGPRPLLIEYLPLYSAEQRKRHTVKPGITGWAQINGRNAISWDEKFKFDIWYADNLCFTLDIKILALTVKKVFRSENINTSNKITMAKFTGSNN